jgi:hypothetical protein
MVWTVSWSRSQIRWSKDLNPNLPVIPEILRNASNSHECHSKSKRLSKRTVKTWWCPTSVKVATKYVINPWQLLNFLAKPHGWWACTFQQVRLCHKSTRTRRCWHGWWLRSTICSRQLSSLGNKMLLQHLSQFSCFYKRRNNEMAMHLVLHLLQQCG